MTDPTHTAIGTWSGGRFMRFGEQLDDERLIALLRPDEVFSDDSERLWSDVLERKGGRYGLVARMPEDPRVN